MLRLQILISLTKKSLGKITAMSSVLVGLFSKKIQASVISRHWDSPQQQKKLKETTTPKNNLRLLLAGLPIDTYTNRWRQ